MKHFGKLATLVCLCMFVSISSFAQAQPAFVEVDTPKFFVSILAGVLLAIGFQVLLTSLSVAAGISAIGNIEKKRGSSSGSNSNDNDDDTPVGVKISTGVGVWTMITASIALFCASLLAVELSIVGNVFTGITLGLVIWATFFVIMAYLEIRSVSSLLGALVNAVTSSIKLSASALQNMFQSSPYNKIEKIAENTVEKVRNEMSATFNTDEIVNKIDEYVNKLQPEKIDYDRAREELKNLIRDIELEERTDVEGSTLDKKTFIQLASEQPNLSKKDIRKLGEVFDQIRGIAQSDRSKEGKVKQAISEFTAASEDDVDNFVQKIEDYLKGTGKEELDPDAIRHDIERIAENPAHARSILSERVQQMDRSTIVSLLAQNKKISEQQAEKVASYVEDAIDWVSKKVSQTQNQASAQANRVETEVEKGKVEAEQKKQQLSAKVEQKVKSFFDSLDRPELSYESLKWDIEKMMNNPKDSFSIIKARLQQFDRETLMALLTANDNISRRDVENFTNKIEETKNQVLAKVEEMEAEAQRQVRLAKQEALHQAENARKTAAAAAWWLFATAIVSGIAAALGGMIAMIG